MVSNTNKLIMIFIVCIFLQLQGNNGASHSDSVFQTPPFIMKRSGESVDREINCSHSIPSYDVILWYKQDQHQNMKFLGYLNVNYPYPEDDVKGKISFDGDASIHSQSGLSVSNLSSEDSGVYFCAAHTGGYSEAYFGAGTKLTVLEPGHNVSVPTVKVFPPSANECRNQKDRKRKKTLVCVASGFYPDHVSVSWQVGEGAVSSGVATDSSALREDKTYRISSRLRVSASDWFTPGRKFTCRVNFFNGIDTSHHENTVEGVQGKEGAMTREKYLKTTQAAKLSYVVLIVKSSVYGAGVAFLLWRLQSSAGKQSN